MTTRLLLLAALLALVPPAQAQDGANTATWRLDADQITLEAHASISGAQAAEYRQDMDRDQGNGDGTLTSAEVQAWQRANTETFSKNKPECFEDFQFLRLDGQGPLRVSEISVADKGAEGPTTSQATVQHSFSFGFQYRAPQNERPTAFMNLDGRSESSLYTGLECYLGYNIEDRQEGPSVRYVIRIHPLGDAEILKDTLSPPKAQQYWDGEGLRFNASDTGVPLIISFTVHDAAPTTPATIKDFGALLGYAAIGTAGLLGLGALFTELGRYKFLQLLFLVPGFTRVEKDEVLDHSRREELYNFIKSNPGPSFSDLRRSLELSNGTLVHHLRILETQEYIKGVREGFRTRFYIRGPKIVPATYLTRVQQQLLEVIRAHPGLTQRELSGLVGLPRQSLFYHTKQLASQGKLEIKQDGNRRRYWLRPGPATMTGGLRPT